MLDYLFGANIRDVDSLEWDVWEDEARNLVNELIAKGKRVYQMPIGGSTAVGALGYVDCMKEIVEYSLSISLFSGSQNSPTTLS